VHVLPVVVLAACTFVYNYQQWTSNSSRLGYGHYVLIKFSQFTVGDYNTKLRDRVLSLTKTKSKEHPLTGRSSQQYVDLYREEKHSGNIYPD